MSANKAQESVLSMKRYEYSIADHIEDYPSSSKESDYVVLNENMMHSKNMSKCESVDHSSHASINNENININNDCFDESTASDADKNDGMQNENSFNFENTTNNISIESKTDSTSILFEIWPNVKKDWISQQLAVYLDVENAESLTFEEFKYFTEDLFTEKFNIGFSHVTISHLIKKKKRLGPVVIDKQRWETLDINNDTFGFIIDTGLLFLLHLQPLQIMFAQNAKYLNIFFLKTVQ